ncbi:uncharacterized protein LOC132296272 [Cornus florida]|uniref:uncharacterized protein LOC132296272 n=1 Tax=Cornus florida TaxID=4283 RepID=UPI00289D92EB|nr:uncharacterized protein LOC132296272 [Cornus florida]
MHGSSNGLICLSNEGTGTVFLWNPALRKLKTLPNSLILDSKSDHLAFGFYPGVDDYKVVRIFYWHDMDMPFKDRFLIEVYSLNTNSWRRIDVGPSCYIFPQKPAIVIGAVYWVGMRRPDEGDCSLLMHFEMGDEVFEKCDIWTMEGGKLGCWIKRFTVNVNIPDQSNIIMLGLRKSGELLQADSLEEFIKGDWLLSYNFETQRAKDLGIHGYLGTYSAYSYVESFIQLDGAESLFSGHLIMEIDLENACDAAIFTGNIDLKK